MSPEPGRSAERTLPRTSRMGDLLARAPEAIKSWFNPLPPSGWNREITAPEERSRERERIARELQESLLQKFMTATMELDNAVRHIPGDTLGKPALTSVLANLQIALEEGRETLLKLREPGIACMDLEEALAMVNEEFVTSPRVGFRVFVTGYSLRLKPAIREQLYLIGREALVNAFRHSRATSIETEVEYLQSRLCVFIRDNGCGFNTDAAGSERAANRGLVGMQERAGNIGARLEIWTRKGCGTEVKISLPRRTAQA